VVAEGVETGEQLERLQLMGCDQYQGYHFSPALPANQFEQLISKTNGVRNTQAEFNPMLTHSKLAAYRRS